MSLAENKVALKLKRPVHFELAFLILFIKIKVDFE